MRRIVLGILAWAAACGVFCRSARAEPDPSTARSRGQARPAGAIAATAPVRPRIEVVFALDTTGSMASLIDGAKRKIWSIADELASAQPQPDLRVGLIAYRDRGDRYVTRRFDLTDDLDALYAQLSALDADGGGDEPESVNQALHEAVSKTQWSRDPKVYRTVFLVGDAPPHMDYKRDVPYMTTVARAREQGIVINTVQCGELSGTRPVWSAIARDTAGLYAAIEQGGGMHAVAAPMDDEITRLNAELADTVLEYGSRDKRAEVLRKRNLARSASAEASASRRAYLEKKGGNVITGSGDLLDDVRDGRVELDALSASELPSALRDKTRAQQNEELERRRAERTRIKARLDELVDQRAAYVKRHEQARRARGEHDGFDAEVKKAAKAQASAAAGLSYEE